jgi:hypothetical protein
MLGLAATAGSDDYRASFDRDVLPALQKNCQSCHRPGEAAPMSFMTYQETLPWVKAIKAAVFSKQVPPWFADLKYGHFQNERRLNDAEVSALVGWAVGGAPEGAAKDKPAPLQFMQGWNINVVFRHAERLRRSGVGHIGIPVRRSLCLRTSTSMYG